MQLATSRTLAVQSVAALPALFKMRYYESMQDIITIGSAIVDIFVTSSAFELQHTATGTKLCQLYGEKLDAESFELHTGGGGSNTAVAFARAGFSVAVVTETGKDVFSQLVLEDLHKEYVSTNFVVEERKEQTGGSILLVGKDGGRTALVHRGAAALLDPQDIPLRALKHSRWIHLSSIGGRSATLKMIAEAVKSHNLHLSWNPGRHELELLLSGEFVLEDRVCQVLFLNQEEWTLVAPLQDLIRRRVPEIVVTKGSAGGVVYTDTSVEGTSFPSRNIASKDDTGAGDAFAAGYLIGKLSGVSSAQAADWGVKNASSVIQYFGAKPGLLTKEKLAEIEKIGTP